MIDPGIAALSGAFLGGAASLGATLITGRQNSRAAREAQKALVAATALLMQDDFYHFQVTLVRALNECRWWTGAEVLPQQTTVPDRKTVWAALPEAPLRGAGDCFTYIHERSGAFQSQAPSTVTNAVVDAQGWMDYMIQRRALVDIHPPTPDDIETMKWTFALLDIARRELQERARRDATDFSKSHVFNSLTFERVADVFAKECPERLASSQHDS